MVVGADDPFGEKKRERGTKHKIKRLHVHEKYDFDTRAAYYDIAIVEVTKEIRFRPTVWPICIPELVNENRDKYRNQTVKVIGYGPIREGDDTNRTGKLSLGAQYYVETLS